MQNRVLSRVNHQVARTKKPLWFHARRPRTLRQMQCLATGADQYGIFPIMMGFSGMSPWPLLAFVPSFVSVTLASRIIALEASVTVPKTLPVST